MYFPFAEATCLPMLPCSLVELILCFLDWAYTHKPPIRERNLVGFTNRWHAFFDRTVPNIILRMIVMVCGLAFVAASVGLTRATGLGTSPISCVPTTLSFFTPLTIGGWTFVMNVLFVVLQIILLRRDFKIVQLLQIPYVFVFSA